MLPALRLRQAAAKGDLSEVQKILRLLNDQDRRMVINAKSPSSGNSPLLWAAIAASPKCRQHCHENAANYPQIAALLLESGADINAQNKEKKSINDCDECHFWHKVGYHIMHYERPDSIEKTLKTDIERYITRECSLQFFEILVKLKIERLLQDGKTRQHPIKILSLGCGMATEVLALQSYFHLYGREIEFVGIDIDRADIERNNRVYSAFSNVKFYQADAASIEGLEHMGYSENSFDLGVLRNGNFDNSNGLQRKFVDMVDHIFPNFLKNSAPLITTFYSNEEACFFRDLTTWGNFCKQPSLNCVLFGGHGIAFLPVDSSDQHKILPDNISIVTIFDRGAYLAFNSCLSPVP